MNVKINLSAVLGILLAIVLLLSTVVPVASQATLAQVGGFLLPFDGEYFISQLNGTSHDHNEIDFAGSFRILAPKAGTVIYANDDEPSYYNLHSFSCANIYKSANYLVIGHGLKSNGIYEFYSFYYHLAQDSIRVAPGDFVRVGQYIADTGNTGYVIPSEGGTGTHLHLEVSTTAPIENSVNYLDCDGRTNLARNKWVEFPGSVNVTVGFEEYGNQWPIYNETSDNNSKNSYNWNGLGTVDLALTTNLRQCGKQDDVQLFNHIDYGGECVGVINTASTTNIPSWMHVSSVHLHPIWLLLGPQLFHTLTIWDGYNTAGNSTVLSSSHPSLGDWNDRVKSVHNALHNNAPWLLEESYAFQAPFNVNIHVRVANDPDFNAWRVCFDGQNCQENAAPINELYYTWNTYGWTDGNHTISIQYRRTSDNGNWVNADYYETSFYLNPNRQGYAPCGTNAEGARITSGVDCIIVTQDVADLAPVGWADRSELQISVSGPYEAWVYDSSNFLGAARVVRSGQNISVGGNASSIDLKPLSDTPPPNPAGPFTADSNAVHLWHIDDWTGSIIHDAIGTLHGTKVDQVAWITNDLGNAFDKALLFPNPPDGRGVSFPPMENICPMTWEGWIGFPSESSGGRIAGQLAGGGNTGVNKWLLSINGKKPQVEFWSGGGSQIAYSSKDAVTGFNYLMFTYDCVNSLKLYLNNELVGETTTAGVWSNAATTYELGSAEGIGRFHGSIDEVRISNTVRVPSDPPALPTSTPTVTFIPSPTNTVPNTPTATPVVAACPTVTDWKGEYWNNESLTGTPALCRIDAVIDFEWVAGSPDPLISDDHFSARWTKDIYFSAGEYRFDIFHDDGVRLFIDGRKVFDDWCIGCRELESVYSTMTSGTHRISMETYDYGGWASARLTWELNQVPTATHTSMPSNTPTATPTAVACPTITQWKGEYWNNETLSGTPALCRNDTELNFHWTAGSPDPLIADDHFSARWTRTVNFQEGLYTFSIFHDDGFRFYLDGSLLLENWAESRAIETYTTRLVSGNHEIKLEMYDHGGWADAELTWQVNQLPTNTPTYTATYTATPTRTPTSTRTPTPVLLNTGFLNPSSNSAQTGGDNNGYELNPANIYGNNSVFAIDNNSGSNTSTSCTDAGKDKHLFYNYGISLPSTAVIQGIEVRLDAKADSTSGSPKICVQLSWNGGSSWTTAKATSTLTTREQTYLLGTPSDTWGRAWTSSQLSNSNFRVRVIDISNSTARDFSLDWMAVRVTYR